MVLVSSYSMTMTIIGYTNSPTSTIITTVPEVVMPMPDILFCYKGGFNAYKMKSIMGLSDALIKTFTKNFNIFLLEDEVKAKN